MRSGTAVASNPHDASTTNVMRRVRSSGSLATSTPAGVISSHILQSTFDLSISFTEPSGGLRCLHAWFHWNGAELVVCSAGAAPWSGLHHAPVVVSIPTHEVSPQGYGSESATADIQFIEFQARATSDSVLGVAPEYRAAAVRYLGSVAGHGHSDEIGRQLDEVDERMHRLFITSCVPIVDSNRADDEGSHHRCRT